MSEIEPELIHRTFAAEVVAGDGRTVDCRIVPYGERIQHDDGLGGLPKGMPYTEEWAAGAFAHQERAANRVLANVEHEQGILGVVGHGLALRETPDGLYGSFKLHDGPAGDTALQLLEAGSLPMVSLEAKPQVTKKTRDGVVRRIKADLRAVAFTRFGAYAGATVLALREEATFEEEQLPKELLPVPIDSEVVATLRRLGVPLPERYEAHPDETDTPEASGTSEIGTRQSTETATGSEEQNGGNSE